MLFLVCFCEWLKSTFSIGNLRVRTWHVETAFVALLLLLVFIYWGRDHGSVIYFKTFAIPVEWIGSLAVLFSFGHASIGFRLQEQQRKLAQETGKATVDCYQILNRYFYAKELCWFTYFLLTGSYAALIGVFIFLGYGYWRQSWRQYHPL